MPTNTFHLFDFEKKKLVFEPQSMYIFEIDEIQADIIDQTESFSSLDRKYAKPRLKEAREKVKALNRISTLHKHHNSLLDKDRQTAITSLWINISHTCNMKCTYCFAGNGNYGKEDSIMSSDLVTPIIEFLMKINGKGPEYQIVFFGGEPLTNFPVLKQFVLASKKEAQKRGVHIKFHLITNGTIINKEISDFIKLQKITVQFSLDGPATVHNKLRPYKNGQGTFDTIYKNLLNLKKKGINNIGARLTLTHHNCNVSSIYKFLDDIGFYRIGMVPVQTDSKNDYHLGLKDIELIREGYSKLANEIIESIKKNKKTDLGCFSEYVLQLIEKSRKRFFCGAGYNYISVTPNGELYPCHRLISSDSWRVGDIKSGITNSQTYENFLADPVDKKEYCSQCWAQYFCGGGCSVAGFEKHKSFNHPDEVSCEITKAIVEGALKVYFFMNRYQEYTTSEITPPQKKNVQGENTGRERPPLVCPK